MKKAITFFGKAAELYFLARCADCKTFYEIEEGGQNSLNWQKSAEDVNPDKKRKFSDELYPVLITEYKLNAKGSGYDIETETIMVM